MKPENKRINYDDFQSDLKQRKRKLWPRILAAEPSEHAPGRRPRDPLKEKLLLRLDRARLLREHNENS